MWIPRKVEAALIETARQRPVLLLTGARQTGKTSLLRRAFTKAHFVTLDLPRTASEAEESGEQFLGRLERPLIVDEIQYAPSLLRHVKAEVDAGRKEKGRFFLTGSQKFSLMQGVSESLAGRVAVFELHSLSCGELEAGLKTPADRSQVLNWMVVGGYPEIHAEGLDPQRFYSDYLVTYLERDVRQLLNVRSLRDFDRFMRLLASRSGQLLSLNSFASELGISPNTAKAWLSVLEASNIVCLLPPYFRNFGKRIVKTPKLYFLDTGLALFLLGIESPRQLLHSSFLGPMFETFVLGQLIRHYANRGVPAPLYFFRDHHGVEVDFVLARGDEIDLLEAKWSENPADAVKQLDAFSRSAKRARVRNRTVVLPDRGHRRIHSADVTITDPVSPIAGSEK